MKKIFLVSFCLFSLNFYGQNKFNAGLNAGVVGSQVHGDNYSGFDKGGYIAGISVGREINERIGLEMEMNILQKGSRKNQDPEKGDYKFYLLRLNYVEVPVTVRRAFKKWICEGGFAYAALFKSKEFNELGEVKTVRPFKKTDFSILFGLNYMLSPFLSVNARYINSIIPVRTFEAGAKIDYNNWFYNLFNRGYYNNVLTFTLQYRFKNESKT